MWQIFFGFQPSREVIPFVPAFINIIPRNRWVKDFHSIEVSVITPPLPILLFPRSWQLYWATTIVIHPILTQDWRSPELLFHLNFVHLGICQSTQVGNVRLCRIVGQLLSNDFTVLTNPFIRIWLEGWSLGRGEIAHTREKWWLLWGNCLSFGTSAVGLEITDIAL